MHIRNLSLIVAMDGRRLIGKAGGLPWVRPKGDTHWFRTHTLLQPVIMGRKTYESLPGPLEKRINIVLSRRAWDEKKLIDGVDDAATRWARDPLEALDFAGRGWLGQGATEAVVIGGAEIYQIFLPFVGKVFLTMIDGEHEGDTYFPGVFAEEEWTPVAEPVKGQGFSCHVLSRPQPVIAP
jgi:dihydrofolate reductase